ncbi:MAG: T9SS type A sorting domain-containing protein [Lewinellaceae bacterium]|nr:T9SS type A sorting domain-containing protein [Lewinellaceae bacterium]
MAGILSFFCNATYGQPAVEWYNSTDVGEAGEYSGTALADWIFEMITTQEGNYLAVGFALEDEANSTTERLPSFALYSPHGHLLQDAVVGEDKGQFDSVTEGEDYYYAVGYQGDSAILARIRKDDLNTREYPLNTSLFTYDEGTGNTRIKDALELECNSEKRVFCAGFAKESGGERRRWISSYSFDSNGDITLEDEWVSPTSSPPEEFYALIANPQPNGSIELYTLSQIMKQLDTGGGALRHHDYDIRVQKFTYDCSTGFSAGDSEDLNSIPWTARDLEKLTGTPSPGTILGDYYPDAFQDEYPYGPKYLGTSFERTFDNCNETSPSSLYVEDWADGSEDIAWDFVDSGDELVIAALLNRLEMWTFNQDLGGDAYEGLQCDDAPCHDFHADAYLWGEAYLLFVDKDDLSLSNASHLGTFSGGDFRPKIVQTPDGGFAVVGTVSGCLDGETEPVEGFETFFVVKTDDSGNVEWRKSIKGPGDGSCGFAITLANDGGLVIGGNLAREDAEEEEEDYLIVKLGPDPCEFSGDLIEANSSNNYYIVSSTEVWDSDLTVTARVAVMSGAELTIEGGSPSSPVTIQFADSEERFDFDERSPIGIQVLAGGRLTVENAKLIGTECNGITRMWDGISVEGNPNQEQNNTYQGYCSLENTIVENARYGLTASEVWMKQEDLADESTEGESVGILSKASLSTAAKGGARIATLNSEFLNNYRSAHFAKYLYSPNQSAFYFTDFTSDGPLVDPDLALRPVDPEQSFDHNESRGTFIHASIWSTRVRFAGCNFTGSTAIIPDLRPRGIEGDDPMIVATGGSMKDMLRGVWCRNLTGGLLANVELSGMDFDDVREGVRLGGSAMDRITGCTFTNIPLQTGFGAQEPYGIFAENAKGARIYANSFSGADADEVSFGLVVLNSKDDGALVAENQFETIRYGNQFLGNNGELIARCNDFTDMGLSAWSVVPNKGSGDLADQGATGPKADNEFFDTCDYEETGYSHIYSDDIEFEYHDKTGNPHPADEDCVTDPPVDFTYHSDGSEIACDPEDPEDPPCAEPSTPGLPSPYPPCDHLYTFMISGQGLEDRNHALRNILHPGVDSLDSLLPFDIEDALDVLETRNEPEDKALRIGTLVSLDRFAEAQTVLDSMPDFTLENETYVDFIAALLQDTISIDSISETAYQTALEALEEDNTSAQVLAQNLRYFREQIYTPVHPVIVDDLENRSFSASKILEYSDLISDEMIYPNPFTQDLTFDLRDLDPEKQYRIEIFDSMGRQLWNAQSYGGSIVKWIPKDLKPGVYFYSYETNHQTQKHGKVVKL